MQEINNELFPDCDVYYFKNGEEWHMLRSKGIGGSEISVILNRNKYKSRYELWLEKTNRKKPDVVYNESIDMGNRLEPVLINLFYGIYKNEIKEIIDTKEISLSRKDKPYMRANLDGAFIDKDGHLTILEIKTSTIKNFEMLEEWGIDEDGNEKIPFSYYCQCLWYMAVTGAKKVVLYAMLNIPWGRHPRQETRIATINYEDVREDVEYIIERAEEFWKEVENNIMPIVVNRKYEI